MLGRKRRIIIYDSLKKRLKEVERMIFYSGRFGVVAASTFLIQLVLLLVYNEFLGGVTNSLRANDSLSRIILVLFLLGGIMCFGVFAMAGIIPRIMQLELRDYVGIRVVPVEDEVSPDDDAYINRVYRRLTEEILDPDITSIKVLSVAALGTGLSAASGQAYNDKWRENYLEQLNDLISEKSAKTGNNFTYIRLYQKTPAEYNSHPLEVNSIAMIHHIDKIEKLQSALTPERKKACNIEIGTVPTTRNTGYMLINEKKLIIFISAIFEKQNESIPYISGLLIFENTSREANGLISDFRRRFDGLLKEARANKTIILQF